MTRNQIIGLVSTSLLLTLLAGVGIGHRHKQEIITLNEAHRVAMANKDIDVEFQKRKTEAMEAEVDALNDKIAALEADKKAALDRLDSDHDGVEIPTDLCPNSAPVDGGPTAVNKNGCLDIEIAMSCDAAPYHPIDAPTKWVFSEGCELSDDPALAYECIADYAEGWQIEQCASFNPSTPGG